MRSRCGFYSCPTSAFKSIALSSINPLQYSTITPTRELKLARLFEPDLNKLRLTRKDLIDTPPSTYGQTKLWAEAIHAGRPDIEGIIWTSRRCDPDTAMILFGDRVPAADLTPLTTRTIRLDVSLLDELHRFAEMAGITLTI